MTDQNSHERHSKSHDGCNSTMGVVKVIFKGCKSIIEHLGTMLYREMLKRNTIKPIQQIVKESDQVRQRKLLCKWTQTKDSEYNYIQLAVRIA